MHRSISSCLLAAAVAGFSCATAQAQSSPSCTTNAAKFAHRWGGLVHDAFQSRISAKAWLCEDGGRIRYSSTGDFAANAVFQRTPDEVRSQLRRIFFLDDSHGWAVGDDGIVLETTDSGTTWTCQWQELDTSLASGKATLFDVNFTSATEGFLLGLHQLKKWDSVNSVWVDMPVQKANGNPLSIADPVELYAMDFLKIGSRTIGLAVAEPGYILRYDSAVTPAKWVLVLDLSTTNLGCTGSFEPWDVAWIPTQTGPFSTTSAVVVGGIVHQCGYVFASSDGGRTWAQEQHECLAPGGCSGQAAHACPTALGSQLHSFATLYGVTTYADGTAVACGYGGQHVRRVQSGGSWIWEDQSDATAFLPGSVTTPLMGTDGDGLVSGGVSWVVGMFGAVRKTTDGGTCFTNDTVCEPFRVQDVYSFDKYTGWQVGQLGRIAKTTDGGVTWCQEQGGLTGKRLNAITFRRDLTGESGIAVGTTTPVFPGCATGAQFPQIYYTTSKSTAACPATTTWTAPLQANVPCEADNLNLHDITWSQDEEYWTVGQGNLVMHTVDGGANWTYDAPSATPTAVWQGVAFAAVDQGVIVGDEDPGTGTREAVAYRYNAGTWSKIQFETSVPPVRVLMDVAARGSAVYACGITQNDEGIVLKWVPSSGKFTRETLPITLPYVILDGDFDDGAEHTYSYGPNPAHSGTILNDVEIVSTTGEVFVGGDGGRMLHKANGTWDVIKSETSLHIYGMSFADGTTGFINSLGRASSVVLQYAP